ncbi:MAG: helix-turn-helix transcriptional regulator [Hyphomicrobiales bacterium]|nr:helix-turn-helix transcriptional regulator [Hyphomicrobiales bacterium]
MPFRRNIASNLSVTVSRLDSFICPARCPRGKLMSTRFCRKGGCVRIDMGKTAPMSDNRLRQIRKDRGVTLEKLAETTGLSVTYLSRVETGKRGITLEGLEKVAQALSVSVNDIIPAGVLGMAEDAQPFLPPKGSPLARTLAGTHQALYRIKSDVLSELGIRAGELHVVDYSSEAIASVKAGDAVIVQLYDDKNLTAAKTIVRQFVPPKLLISNSRDYNTLPIHMDAVDAHIRGVILRS